MRMWMIDPRLLCRKHLLGEHSELHKFRHEFVKGRRMDGRAGQIEPRSMQKRHDALAAEMIRRGYRHESPYEQPDVSAYDHMPPVDDVKSLKDLRSRCDECRKSIEAAVGEVKAILIKELFSSANCKVERTENGMIRYTFTWEDDNV